MVSFEEIQAAYYMVAATGVLAAAIYYVYNMRTSRRTLELTLEAQQQSVETRQTQLFMDIYKTYSLKEYQQDREDMALIWKFSDFDDFIKKYGPVTNPAVHAKWDTQMAQYAGIGVLIKRGMISPDLVFDLIFESTIAFWEKFVPVVEGLRKSYMPTYGQDAEFLYQEMKRLSEERGLTPPNWREPPGVIYYEQHPELKT